jgi:hypothetical protein
MLETAVLSVLMAATPAPAPLAAPDIAAAASTQAVAVEGYVSAWTQDCPAGACALPKPGERNAPVAISLDLPQNPGGAAAARASRTLSLGADGELSAELDFYAVCPYGGGPGACAGRYFQAQVTLSGAATAFCAAALDQADFAPFPVMMCAGVSAAGKRFGITLHRRPL